MRCEVWPNPSLNADVPHAGAARQDGRNFRSIQRGLLPIAVALVAVACAARDSDLPSCRFEADKILATAPACISKDLLGNTNLFCEQERRGALVASCM
jgi:hypothetical protein